MKKLNNYIRESIFDIDDETILNKTSIQIEYSYQAKSEFHHIKTITEKKLIDVLYQLISSLSDLKVSNFKYIMTSCTIYHSKTRIMPTNTAEHITMRCFDASKPTHDTVFELSYESETAKDEFGPFGAVLPPELQTNQSNKFKDAIAKINKEWKA